MHVLLSDIRKQSVVAVLNLWFYVVFELKIILKIMYNTLRAGYSSIVDLLTLC